MAARKPGKAAYPVSFPAIMEFIWRPVSGDLTTDGVQYTPVATTGAADALGTPFQGTLDVGVRGVLLTLDYGLSMELRGTTATADITYVWRARDSGAVAWKDLFATATATNPGTAFVGTTYSGYGSVQSGMGSVPLEVCLAVSCNEGTAGVTKVKSSSYVRAVFKPT